MNTDNNRRWQATDEGIIREVYRIMQKEKRPVSKITVREICEGTGINRSTFYAHYQDVFDVVEKVEQQIAKMTGEAFINNLPKEDWMHAGFVNLFAFIREYKEFYLLYLEDSRRMRAIEMLIEPHQEKLGSVDPKTLGYSSREEMAYAQDFFAAGAAALLYRWLKNGCKESPEELYAILQWHCVPPNIFG